MKELVRLQSLTAPTQRETVTLGRLFKELERFNQLLEKEYLLPTHGEGVEFKRLAEKFFPNKYTTKKINLNDFKFEGE